MKINILYAYHVVAFVVVNCEHVRTCLSSLLTQETSAPFMNSSISIGVAVAVPAIVIVAVVLDVLLIYYLCVCVRACALLHLQLQAAPAAAARQSWRRCLFVL